MTETAYDALSDAISAINKIKLTPEDGAKFIDILSTLYGVGKLAPPKTEPPAKKRSSSKILDINFGTHLKDAVKDSPKTPEEIVEPLRERGVRLASDNEIAIKQILRGFRKSPSVYRKYPEGKYGLISYAVPRLVG